MMYVQLRKPVNSTKKGYNYSLMCMFCRSSFVLFPFFFWPLCCLFFFDLRILVTLLVSSNSSEKKNKGKLLQTTNLIIESDIRASARQITLILYVLLPSQRTKTWKEKEHKIGAQRTTIIQIQK